MTIYLATEWRCLKFILSGSRNIQNIALLLKKITNIGKGDDVIERTLNDMYISTEGGLNGISLENELVVSITLCERVGYHFDKK